MAIRERKLEVSKFPEGARAVIKSKLGHLPDWAWLDRKGSVKRGRSRIAQLREQRCTVLLEGSRHSGS
jgi:hypothetical protein